MNPRRSTGFALLEMVMVILILGIIATIAAPSMFDPAAGLGEHRTRHQLSVLREAIDLYHQRNGSYPPLDGLPQALEPLLNGPLPAPRIGSVRGDAGVYYDIDPEALTPVIANPANPGGWAYKPANGSLKLNVPANQPDARW